MHANSKIDVQNHADGSELANPAPLLEYRNNVYSQSGEDGIIAAILSRLPTLNHWCVEFGAWDGIYLSNTRTLIEHKGYHAVLIEANKKSFLKLKENTKDFGDVVVLNAFVGVSTMDSLDVLLSATACPYDFDFLSIDIDGNDIHVWRAIKRYRPKLICIEFNPTIPTEVTFEQPPNPKVNWGSSLAALVHLGKEKGYELICTNEINAFFITSELFPIFSIVDNSPSALRPNDAARTMIFSGFDGTLLVTGDVFIPWHRMSFAAKDIQPIPAFLRKYPQNYNLIQRKMARAYRLFHRARNFVRSAGRPSMAMWKLVNAAYNRSRPPADPFLKSCSRIVHIGANIGQERELYECYGLSVVWIEPIPAVYQELVRNIKPYPRQRAIQALLTDRPGDMVKFNIASNSGASSSIFDLALHKDIWPEVGYVDQIELRTETLDRVLAMRGIDLPIDALILDTQGSELLVLKGAEAALRQVSFVKIEAADFEAYKGCATVATIEAFLKKFSFRRVKKTRFARHPSGGGYYDLLFKRFGA